jgi:hypothetical protein
MAERRHAAEAHHLAMLLEGRTGVQQESCSAVEAGREGRTVKSGPVTQSAGRQQAAGEVRAASSRRSVSGRLGLSGGLLQGLWLDQAVRKAY